MKKISATLAILFVLSALCAAIFLPTRIFAENAGSDVYLFNPVSVDIAGNLLFVADDVTDAQSLLHVFDVSSAPRLLENKQSGGEILRVKAQGDSLFLIYADKFVQYAIENDTVTEKQTYDVANVVDVALTEDALYYGTREGHVYNHTAGGLITSSANESLTACATIDDTVYWLYKKDTKFEYNGYHGGWWEGEKQLNSSPEGMFAADGALTFYNGTNVFSAADTVLPVALPENTSFLAVCAGNGALFAALSDNTVAKWTKTGDNYVVDGNFAIGSDTVDADVPETTSLTGFTAATAKGYPANVIYKTTGENSIERIIDNADRLSFVILHYEEENPDYYYVFVNDRFGWIKKSGATPAGDDKIQILPNALSDDTLQYSGRLLSANAVYVYLLPCSSVCLEKFPKETLKQDALSQQQVTLLSRFTAEDGLKWYLVSYLSQGTEKTGFVRQSDVGQIRNVVTGEIPLVAEEPRMKVNATLYSSVELYLTEEMEEAQLLFENDKQIRLETGTLVNVLVRGENASKVQVVRADGSSVVGWIANNRLISVNAMTTNAVVGMILLLVAVSVLSVALILLNRKRKSAETVITPEE